MEITKNIYNYIYALRAYDDFPTKEYTFPKMSDLYEYFAVPIKKNNNEECKLCLSKRRNIVLIPCGHTLSIICKDTVNICPRCNKNIQGYLKFFL